LRFRQKDHRLAASNLPVKRASLLERIRWLPVTVGVSGHDEVPEVAFATLKDF
jgi:hypothetical protein